jgi:hypothetical protein
VKIFEKLGTVPMRCRENSSRIMLPYRAATGQPPKRKLKGTHGQIEVLGEGYQGVVHGIHKTGVPLYWVPAPLWDYQVEELPAITEEQVTELLREIAPIIGAKPEDIDAETRERTGDAASEPPTPSCDIDAALFHITNDGPADWEWWNAVGMSVWFCSRGSDLGKELWKQWSRKNSCHDDAVFEERWANYFKSPPTETGYQKLAAMATAAIKEGGGTGFVSPSEAARAAAAANDNGEYLLTLDDILAMPEPEWLLEDVLVEDTFAAIYGPPKSLKSFIVLDFAMHLACGLEWRGRPVKQRGILYIAAEGVRGLRRRLEAWLDVHDPELTPNIRFRHVAVNLTKAAEAKQLINKVLQEQRKSGFDPDLIIVDTLARCSAGADENSAKEMGIVVENGAMIQKELGATLLVVHHCGKDASKGLRGSSAIFGAVDSLLQVIRDGLNVSLLVENHKDSEDGMIMKFEAKPVELARDKDGKLRTSLVLHPIAGGEAGAPGASLSEPAQRSLIILKEMVGRASAPFHPTQEGLRCAIANSWKEECLNQGVAKSDKHKSQKQAFDRAYEAIKKAGLIEEEEGLIWPAQ